MRRGALRTVTATRHALAGFPIAAGLRAASAKGIRGRTTSRVDVQGVTQEMGVFYVLSASFEAEICLPRVITPRSGIPMTRRIVPHAE